jgi:hypothetical protein
MDVSQTPSVEDFVKWARAKTSAVDVLINNAGGAHGLQSVANGRDEDWETTLQTNVLGLLRVTRAVLPLMPRDAGSSILNIGSVAGRFAYEGGADYCAAKAGELKITQVLRLELNGTGIRISSIDPGMARTEFSAVRFKGDTARADKVYEGTHPLEAEDVAETLVWVASRPAHPNARSITAISSSPSGNNKARSRAPGVILCQVLRVALIILSSAVFRARSAN